VSIAFDSLLYGNCEELNVLYRNSVVDDSGGWPDRGVFAALDALDSSISDVS
jgi:hypothetical protein